MPGRWRVRRYDASDFCSVARLLSDAFVSSSTASVRFSLSTPNTTAFVAEVKDSVIGVAMTIGFGQTAWVGSVVVSSGWQRQGLGSALTERAVEHALLEARTVLLLAVGPARRLYARLGFEDECSYGTWILSRPALDAVTPTGEACRETGIGSSADVLAQCAELDRSATGEQRHCYLQPLAAAMRVVSQATGRRGDTSAPPVGFTAQLGWGAGPIIATDADTGAFLVREALVANPKARIEFPDANEPGCNIMRELGLVRVDDDYRMRLGLPVPGFRPQFIYKVLTPTVG